MRNSKKILLMSFIIILTFLFNMNSVLANKFYKASTTENLSVNGDTYVLSCESITATLVIHEVKDNNESKSDCNDTGGVFWNATNSSRVADLTRKLNKVDGENHFVLWAHSVSHTTTDKITITINNSTTEKKCVGKIQVTPYHPEDGSGSYHQENSSVKFDIKVDTSETEEEQQFKTKVKFNVVKVSGVGDGKEGDPKGNYAFTITGTTDVIAKEMAEYAQTGSEEDKKQAEEAYNNQVEESGNYIESGGKEVAEATSPAGNLAGEGQAIQCDNSLSDFIGKYWKYFIIATPILLMVMITMDFFKALFSSDQDLIKKASNNAIKRVIAAILLLFLPLIISTILGFFGLELCI